MRTLLRIEASVRTTGSHSRALADHFEKQWRTENPDGRVITRNLAQEPVPHLDQSTVSAFMGLRCEDGALRSAVEVSDALIAELTAADDVLVASPVYNFNAPSTLKAWADHVVRVGRTVRMDERGFHGLLNGRTAWIVTARGGNDPRQLDYQGPFLQAVFRYLGFGRVEWAALEGTAMDAAQREQAMRRALEEINEWFSPPAVARDEGGWCGSFTVRDRAEIVELRDRQVRAILVGDADAYAALCVDDIVLMLQGRGMVIGREDFRRCEADLLRRTRFTALRQMPVRIEREGSLAVETGTQDSVVEGASAESANYLAQRKYTHVLRKTANGWRFAVLMSNNSQ